MEAIYKEFVKAIRRQGVDSKRIYTDALRTLAWGTDASFYRLLPQVVVRVKDEAEMQAILREASERNLPFTFRAAGTSLSGQSLSDSILLVAGKSWEGYRILDPEAHEIALQPGIIGERVSQILEPYGRVFSPDPASKKSAMVGGIVANNASGMKCGTHANSDRILRSMRIILADGTVLDTGDEKSRAAFRQTHADLLNELESIRKEIRDDAALSERIRYKYSIKNVTGLNLLPFVMYDDVFDIIAHMMVGSEGTLAFISEVRMSTEAKPENTASAMIYFRELTEACRAVVALKKSGAVDACELLDRKSLESAHDTTGEGLTALLLRVDASTETELKKRTEQAQGVINGFDLFRPAEFSTDPKTVADWWLIRSGIFPAVGGTRKPGTTALIEDIAFHIDDLPAATAELQKLLEDCGYEDACIYGHALEGNYHFVIAQAFDTQAEIDRYRRLMESIEKLVVEKYDGSLKAEHGTGRNMAPFVEREWGAKAWGMMRRIKKAFDPRMLLNPGVIFNDDPECFIHSLKPLPLTNPIVDKCIECGFCEVNCVSCGLTLSARQRIVSQREITRLEACEPDSPRLKELKKEFKYYGEETCAGDGLCSTSCPMKINTGDLVHVIREREIPPGSLGHGIGRYAGEHLAGVSTAVRGVLGAASVARKIIGVKGVEFVGTALHGIGMPLWTPSLPKPFSSGKLVKNTAEENEKRPERRPRLVYFPSCLNRVMGAAEDAPKAEEPLAEVFVRLCERAGYEVVFPNDMSGLCCGMIWESKGMPDIAESKVRELEAALAAASEGGRIPVVCDQSPCLHRMRKCIKSMKLYEPSEFIHDYLAKHLTFRKTDRPVAVHITCSTRLMGIGDKLVGLAGMCSTNVTVPAEVGCCGFAGDKGFTHPELNRWGLRKLRKAIEGCGAEEGYSNSRTCEIGLTTNSGIPYQSIVYLVEECTR
ncbi:MAG: FAD-binding oxidoreductase [Muribaculaceae bacterium]|nr:FAD-binding oxidoreductase [Muribaculaceae bacterium]